MQFISESEHPRRREPAAARKRLSPGVRLSGLVTLLLTPRPEEIAMPNTFRNEPPPWMPEHPVTGPQDLPHGLLTPPPLVRDVIAREKATFPPDIYNVEAEQRSLNDHTLQFYFESFWFEVLYRSTPDGPEVLAVGYDEILAFTKDMPLEARGKLTTWMP
jgi:hypothetical protein